jgi:hypothetical protein
MDLAYGPECKVDFSMSPGMRLAIVAGLTVASWVVPTALVYGLLQLI